MKPADQYATIQTEGRKSGRQHLVRVRYAEVGGVIVAFAGAKASDWARNALASGAARVTAGGLAIDSRARAATSSEADEAMRAFVRKYGRRVVRQWYSRSSACVCFLPMGPPVPAAPGGGEFGARTTFREWSARKSDYYAAVASAFDSASGEYDFTIGQNFINTWIRRNSVAEVLRYASPEETLVEVGCGTGTEAMLIAPSAGGIVATDISPSMIELLKAKAATKGMSARVRAVRLRAAEIARAGALLPGGTTGLVYSLNGALNCEPELDRFVEGLATIVRPGGHFVCSIRNSFCLAESLAYLAVLRPADVNPRKRQPMMVSVGGMDIPSTYYQPRAFAGRFRGSFAMERMVALPALLPPAYLNEYYLKVRPVLSLLERLDAAVSGRFPFNMWGDQTLFVMRRT